MKDTQTQPLSISADLLHDLSEQEQTLVKILVKVKRAVIVHASTRGSTANGS